MTTTAEERAKAIVDAEWEFIKANDMFVSAGTLDRIQASLTQALHQAQNDKLEEAGIAVRKLALEEAARICDAHAREWEGIDRCNPLLFQVIAKEIRSLKSKD